MPEPHPRATSNRILSALTQTDFQLLEPRLETIDLPVRKQLEKAKKRVEHVYFMESGMASVVADGGRKLEVGIVGREGMTGLSVVLTSRDPAPHETFIQIAGKGMRIVADDLRDAIGTSVPLHHAMLRYANAFMIQTTETAIANGRGKAEQRLARWLLMVDDRIDGSELPLTHEFLAIMLGVQRPGVTLALQDLERTGLISHRRSFISIVDRKGLEEFAAAYLFPLEGILAEHRYRSFSTCSRLPTAPWSF